MGLITILGRVPSKKNSKVVVCRGKFPQVLPSKAYNEWHKYASSQLVGVEKIPDNSKIEFVMYAPDKRVADLSNKWESVADLLVDNKIISDDNWFVLGDVHMRFGGVDKDNPRIEIYVS